MISTLMHATTPARVLHHIDAPISYTPSSAGFAALVGAFRATGGTERGDDLAVLLQNRCHGGHVSLARLIATRQVLAFTWRNTFWVPLFQFDLKDLSIRRDPQKVMVELCKNFDEWSMAVWFAQPNAWLNDERPVDLLNTELQAVIDAARADRFVAAG